MGQSPSTALPSQGPNRREIPYGDDGFRHGVSQVGHDYTAYIPDECLASIFQFLGSTDRKRCSTVCRRWLRVDGENRRRLSLNAESGLTDHVPSLFSRFDSVTKLALRCDRRSTSINDDALILISLRCVNLTRLKLRGCREITETGMAGLAKNCKLLKKLSCGSCTFGAKGLYAVIEHCTVLEELSLKRLRGVDDDISTVTAPTESVSVSVSVSDSVSAVSASLKSICLKELVNGRIFAPLVIGSKKLETLKVIRCLGDWDSTLDAVGRLNPSLVNVHLEKIQVSDLGLLGISKCLKLESLHLVKTPECSDFGLSEIAGRCNLLKKLHIDGWRTNRIGHYGLISVANGCPNLQELVLIAMYPSSLSLSAIASNCRGLERLAFCGVATVGDAEIECIASKCVALKKLCIKGCPVTNSGIEAFASGCPNLVKLKVRKCRKVSGEVVEWLCQRRSDLAFSFDYTQVEGLDVRGTDLGVQDSTMMGFPPVVSQIAMADDDDAASNSNSNNNNINNRFSMLRTKFGSLVGRNFVPCALRRWANIDDNDISGGSFL